MSVAIRIENLSKRYRLGQTHARSLRDLINAGAARLFGRRASGTLARTPSIEDSERLDESGQFWALRDVSFDVQAGEVIGIIGRNGAGKSTLLKIISHITAPSGGCVQLHGRVASLLEVGTGFHPELTGRENVYLNGTILGMTKAEVRRKFDEIVAFAGIDQFIDTPVKRYSSGMTVRLGFAVAAHLDPEILIVDEVLAVGDIEFQQKCISKMQSVSQTGQTVLFVSHNMASIRALTTRSLVLSRGRLTFSGSTQEAIGRYVEENVTARSTRESVRDRDRPFDGLTGELVFDFLEVEGADSQPLEEGSNVVIRLGIRGCQSVDDFIVGLTIFRHDAIPVGSMFSSPLAAVPVGTTCCIRLRLGTGQLTPGRYYCAVSLSDARSNGRRLLDSLTDVLPFEIEPAALQVIGWSAGWGAIRFEEMRVIQTQLSVIAANRVSVAVSELA